VKDSALGNARWLGEGIHQVGYVVVLLETYCLPPHKGEPTFVNVYNQRTGKKISVFIENINFIK